MIDIGHMDPILEGYSVDVGYLKGLIEMIKMLETLRDTKDKISMP